MDNSLHCVTDYMNCCDSGSGMGNWYDPRGMEVSEQADGDSDSYVTRGDGVVYLTGRRGGQSGMWRCDIPDNSEHYLYLHGHRKKWYELACITLIYSQL